jgi:hypothetical protein
VLNNREIFRQAVKDRLRQSSNAKALRGEWLSDTEFFATDFEPDYFQWAPLFGYRLKKSVRAAAMHLVGQIEP